MMRSCGGNWCIVGYDGLQGKQVINGEVRLDLIRFNKDFHGDNEFR